MRDKKHTPIETLLRAHTIAKAHQLNYVYTGNVHNPKTASTFCPNCKACIIQRNWFELLDYHLTNDGLCEFCKTKIPGVFAGPPGNWGNRRAPIRLN